MNEIFDKSVLFNLRSIEKETGQDIVSEMILEYISDTSKIVKNMRQLWCDDKFTELAYSAHSLKSSSANVGAMALSQFCEQIEKMVVGDKSYDKDRLNQLITEIERTLTPTLEMLKSA